MTLFYLLDIKHQAKGATDINYFDIYTMLRPKQSVAEIYFRHHRCR